MKEITMRAARLIDVKSIVTIMLTAVFCVMALTGRLDTEQYMTVFTVVTAFYFGTQAEKRRNETNEGSGGDEDQGYRRVEISG